MIKCYNEKISCLMVTEGRFDLIKKSITCYINQTYFNKELIIVSQGNEFANAEIKRHIDDLGRGDIIFFEAPLNLSLGGLRNLSVDISQGSLLCQWDDDDLYGPRRLTNQYLALKSNAKYSASLYVNFFKYFKNIGDVYLCDWEGEGKESSKYLCGAIMFKKDIFFKYDNFYPENGDQSQKEEDLHVLSKLIKHGPLCPVRTLDYVYVYHGKNTYDLDHHMKTLQINSGKKVYSNYELLIYKNKIDSFFNEIPIEDGVVLKSLTGKAFEYKRNL